MEKMNKAAARKMWNEGKEFWITAYNLRPECGLVIDPKRIASEFDGDFDRFVNMFAFYHCVNNETGKYPAYYRD